MFFRGHGNILKHAHRPPVIGTDNYLALLADFTWPPLMVQKINVVSG
jgi:hypothetical protein